MSKPNQLTEELLESLPMLRPGLTADEVLAEFKEHRLGKKYKPLELSYICLRLVELGLRAPSIGRAIQRTPEYVNQLLSLAASPREIQVMVSSEKVTAALAIEVIRESGGRAADVLELALVNALSKGRAKITARELPHRKNKRTLAAAAPEMRNLLARIADSNEFKFLPPGIQTEVKDLSESLQKVPVTKTN